MFFGSRDDGSSSNNSSVILHIFCRLHVVFLWKTRKYVVLVPSDHLFFYSGSFLRYVSWVDMNDLLHVIVPIRLFSTSKNKTMNVVVSCWNHRRTSVSDFSMIRLLAFSASYETVLSFALDHLSETACPLSENTDYILSIRDLPISLSVISKRRPSLLNQSNTVLLSPLTSRTKDARSFDSLLGTKDVTWTLLSFSGG